MKQIAGRAGRFGSRWPVGEVTCLNDDGMSHLRDSVAAPLPPLTVRCRRALAVVYVRAVAVTPAPSLVRTTERWLAAVGGEHGNVLQAAPRAVPVPALGTLSRSRALRCLMLVAASATHRGPHRLLFCIAARPRLPPPLHRLARQERFEKATVLDSLYFLCELRDMKVRPRVAARGRSHTKGLTECVRVPVIAQGLAAQVQDMGMSIADQFMFSCAPVNARDKEPVAAFKYVRRLRWVLGAALVLVTLYAPAWRESCRSSRSSLRPGSPCK